MALFDILTDEDLPLSYRFPRWNSDALTGLSNQFYPCASIVIFDVDSESDVEYHIFVAERDINPGGIDPRSSVIADDGDWRDLTGRAIRSITSLESDRDSEVSITLTINYDDNTQSVLAPFTISTAGGGADTASVAISVALDGSLSFGTNLGTDEDAARTAVQGLLRVGYDQLLFTPAVRGGEAGFVANEYIDDNGVPQIIRATFLDDTTTGFTSAEFIFIQTDDVPVAPTGPGPFQPTFTLSAVNGSNNDVTYSLANPLNWDDVASGFRITIQNPTDRQDAGESPVGQAYIQVGGEGATPDIVAVIGGTVDADISSYTSTPVSGDFSQGLSTTRYNTDGDTLGNAAGSFIPTIADQQVDAGSMTIMIDVEQVVSGNDINAITPNNLAQTTGTDYVHNIANEINYVWRLPAHDVITINNNSNLRPTGDQTFLNTVSTASYQIETNGLSGVTDPSIISHKVIGRGTGVTPADSEGIVDTVTFDPPLSYLNQPSAANGLNIETTFSRPAAVTGTSYDIVVTSDSQPIPMVDFTTPSFWFTTPRGQPNINLDRIVAPGTSTFRVGTGTTPEDNGVVLTSTTASDVRDFAGMSIPEFDTLDLHFAIRSDVIGSTAGTKADLLGTNPLVFISFASGQMNTIIAAQTDVFQIAVQPNIATLPNGYLPVNYTIHRFQQTGPRTIDVS